MSRRAARELALRALFAVEHNGAGPDDALDQAAATLPRAPREGFATTLVTGTVSHLETVDEVLLPHLYGWTMAQMPAVDRNLLRIAAYEMLYTAEPVAAVISEAVALARTYSTPESSRFVNGVLGSLAKDLVGG